MNTWETDVLWNINFMCELTCHSTNCEHILYAISYYYFMKFFNENIICGSIFTKCIRNYDTQTTHKYFYNYVKKKNYFLNALKIYLRFDNYNTPTHFPLFFSIEHLYARHAELDELHKN